MRFYNQQHKFYCGIDQKGKTRVHQNLKTDPEALFDVIFPFLEDVVICVECMFSWYWVADFCSEHKIPFVLGHALYMKAIHGGKTKNDKIDSYKIAKLLMGGNLPIAYPYPAQMRSTRDLLRRRNSGDGNSDTNLHTRFFEILQTIRGIDSKAMTALWIYIANTGHLPIRNFRFYEIIGSNGVAS